MAAGARTMKHFGPCYLSYLLKPVKNFSSSIENFSSSIEFAHIAEFPDSHFRNLLPS